MKTEPRHNFDKPDWKEKYTRPPKKENRNVRISGGAARGNFTAHNGGFGGNKTWSVSVMASVVSGVKDKGRASAFAEYIKRPAECLCSVGDENAKEKFAEIEEKLLSENPKRVTQRRLIVPVPTEFLKDVDKNMQKFADEFGKKYFDVCYTHNFALHAGGKDLKNPHIHIIFSPVDNSGKNIRDLSKSNYMFLDSFKKDVGQFIERELNIKCNVGLSKKKKELKVKGGKHYPKWIAAAYKKYSNDPEKLKKYALKYPDLADYISSLKANEKIKNINELEKKHDKMKKEIYDFSKKNQKTFEKITGAEEKQFLNKIQEIKNKSIKEVMNDMDLEPLKNIDVVDLAEKLGFEQDKVDKKAYKRGDLKISIDEKTGRFNSFVNSDIHGRGSIDFVMKTENKDFKGAIEFLSSEYNASSDKPAKPAFLQREKQEEPELKPEPKILEIPTKSKYDQRTLDYLFFDRKVNLQTIKELQRTGRLYQDEKNNAIFVCRDINNKIRGAEVKGTTVKFKGMAKGSDRDKGAFFIYQAEPKTLILTESAIDAISYKDLKNPHNSIIASTSGVMPHDTKFMNAAIKEYSIKSVKIAYDNDAVGQENAESLMADLEKKYPDLKVEIEKSIKKDWNEDLQQRELERNKEFAEKNKKIFDAIKGGEGVETKKKVKEIQEGKEMCDLKEKIGKILNPEVKTLGGTPAAILKQERNNDLKPEKPLQQTQKQEVQKAAFQKEIAALGDKINKLDKKINSKFISYKKQEKLVIESNEISAKKYRLEAELFRLETPKPDLKPEPQKPAAAIIYRNSAEILQEIRQHKISQDLAERLKKSKTKKFGR